MPLPLAKRVFYPLRIAPVGNIHVSANFFLLERFAYVQNRAQPSFDTGPFIEVMTAKEEDSYRSLSQSIETTLKYSLRPYTIQFYGDKDIRSTALPQILMRTWLSHKNDTNHVLVILERIDCKDPASYKYRVDLNNDSWKPSENWNWNYRSEHEMPNLVQTRIERPRDTRTLV